LLVTKSTRNFTRHFAMPYIYFPSIWMKAMHTSILHQIMQKLLEVIFDYTTPFHLVSSSTQTQINIEIHARSRWQSAIIIILSFTCIHAATSEFRLSATYRTAVYCFSQREKRVKRRWDNVTEAITQANGGRILQRSRNRLGSHRLYRHTLHGSRGVCQSEMRCSREVNFNDLMNFTCRCCVTCRSLFSRRLFVPPCR